METLKCDDSFDFGYNVKNNEIKKEKVMNEKENKGTKVFCGNGKLGKFNSVIANVNLSQIPDKAIFKGKKGSYVNLIIAERKEVDKFGNQFSVYLYVD